MSRFDVDAIANAVRELEARTAAELVVEIRGRSGSYARADHRFAAVLTLVSLVVLVYMPFVVPPVTVLLDALAFYLAGLVLPRWIPALRRAFTTKGERTEAVQTQAAALYQQRGIGHTSEETGVLLYASVLEQRMEVLADRGLLRKVNSIGWNEIVAGLHETQAIDTAAVIDAIRRLGAVLERDLPAGDVNADELSNAPGMVTA